MERCAPAGLDGRRRRARRAGAAALGFARKRHRAALRRLLPHRTLSYIADAGAVPGVALNPHTPPDLIEEVKDLLGLALVMTVNPGFGGQKYISSMEPKIKRVAEMLDGLDCDIEVDGGIGVETVSGAVQAGANVLISGSALYRDPKGLKNAVKELRSKAEASQS